MKHTIQTSTSLLPILCPDLYETAISPSFVFEWEQEELASELPEFINVYDMAIDLKKYLDRCMEFANEVIEREILPELKKYGVIDIKAMAFNHPEWYRLGSGRQDIIDLNILVDDKFFQGMPAELARLCKDAAAQQYCRDHWTDGPGFWSFMPGRVEEIQNGWEFETETRKNSAFLTLICRENGMLWRDDKTQEDSEAQSLWEEKIRENMYFMDFISDADAELINNNRKEA